MRDQHEILAELVKLDHAAQLHNQSSHSLIEAAQGVASYIVAVVLKANAVGVALPRGYQVIAAQHRSFGFTKQYFTLINQLLPPFHSRTEALKFAQDIRTGLLVELADFLQTHAKENNEAAAELIRSTKFR